MGDLDTARLPLRAGLPQIRSVYQPIARLDTSEVVAYEALARGPVGTALEAPADLFAFGRQQGLEAELDVACQAAAMQGALGRRLPGSTPLFINAEPRWLLHAWPDESATVRDRAEGRLQIVVEITERALVHDPAGLLRAVRQIRERGWGVALDDVGADPASLALMPFIDPDVIKLDLRLIQQHDEADVAGIVNAVLAQAERSDALILAEGIETEQHLRRAQSLGATLGQGWLLGRPGELPDRVQPTLHDLRFTRSNQHDRQTPFDLARETCVVRTATKGLLLPMSHHLERHAIRTDEKPVLLSTFENADHFTPATADRYRRLADRCSFVGALGVGLSPDPVDGVRGGALPADDPLAGEWVVCVVGPHFAGALIAHDLGDTGPDRDRRFDMTITYDRDLVIAATRTLLARIEPVRS